MICPFLRFDLQRANDIFSRTTERKSFIFNGLQMGNTGFEPVTFWV